MTAVVAGVTSFLVGLLLCAVVLGLVVSVCICCRKYKKGTRLSPRQSRRNSPLYDYVDRRATNTELELKDNIAYGHANIN